MSTIIAITNHKGGVGKTTTAVNLSSALCRRGTTVLVIDLDPQSHATVCLGYQPTEITSIYDVLCGDRTLEETIISTRYDIDLVGADINLSAADIELMNEIGRESILSTKLEPILSRYDYVILDCPPSLSILTLNALVAGTHVLIPVQPSFLSLYGIKKLLDLIAAMQQRLKKNVQMNFLVTMFDKVTNVSKKIQQDLNSSFPNAVYRTVIHRNVALTEAAAAGLPIDHYDYGCRGAEDHRSLAEEIDDGQAEARTAGS